MRVPVDATTGTFSYKSSDESVVTINASGVMIGMKAGTATITVTLTGGKDAEGNVLEPIVKTVTVTVSRGVSSIKGEGTIEVGATFDASKYEVTITYTDGTTEKVSLSREDVVMQEVDTSKVGEQSYNVMVTVDGESVRGTFTLTVTEKARGCGSAVAGTAIGAAALLLAASVAVICIRRKREK